MPHLFFDIRSNVEYNIDKLKSLGTPIARIKMVDYTPSYIWHVGRKWYLLQICGLMLVCTLVRKVKLWYRGPGPSGTVLPNAVVVQFEHLNEEVVPFLDAFPRSVAIPFAEHEWRHNSDVYNRKQYPLMLSSAYTIHKSQSKTLDKVVIDLGTTEKCSGMTLVWTILCSKTTTSFTSTILLWTFEKRNKAKQLQALPRYRYI